MLQSERNSNSVLQRGHRMGHCPLFLISWYSWGHFCGYHSSPDLLRRVLVKHQNRKRLTVNVLRKDKYSILTIYFKFESEKERLLTFRFYVFLKIVTQHLSKEHQIMGKLFQFMARTTPVVYLQPYFPGLWERPELTSTSWSTHAWN